MKNHKMTILEPIVQKHRETTLVFHTALGWTAVVLNAKIITRLTFGHPTAASAKNAVRPATTSSAATADSSTWQYEKRLVERIEAYAAGQRVDFDEFEVDTSSLSQFGRRVITQCRKIPFGETLTYGQLASKAKNPAAARAVGNLMASNRIPIIVPCHRVLPAGKRLGGYSAPGGADMKRRLLEMEHTAQ